MGKTDRKRVACKGRAGWHEFAVDGVSAFAVQRLPGCQIALGDSRDIGTKIMRRSRRLPPKGQACDRDAQFEAYEMIGSV